VPECKTDCSQSFGADWAEAHGYEITKAIAATAGVDMSKVRIEIARDTGPTPAPTPPNSDSAADKSIPTPAPTAPNSDSGAVVCNGQIDCGGKGPCWPGSFCNFDGTDSGRASDSFCQPCVDCPGNTGLPDAGQVDCAACCTDTKTCTDTRTCFDTSTCCVPSKTDFH
jgi:hypothetical protein